MCIRDSECVIGLDYQLVLPVLLDVKGVPLIVVGELPVFWMLRDVVFVTEKRSHAEMCIRDSSRRVICIQYLYRTFVSRVATLLRQTSADFIELQTPAFTAGAGRSIREGISGRYPVILPFELSVVAYPLRNKPDVFSIAWP